MYVCTFYYLISWDEMQWNVTGYVETGILESEKELCGRLVYNNESNKFCIKCNIPYRTERSRLLFNTQFFKWSKCMDTCDKYNRAKAPSFSDQRKLDMLIEWAFNTTRAPITLTLYEDAITSAFWIPYRFPCMLNIPQ